MSITIQEIVDKEQWNSFLTHQPCGHVLQSYEWGELNKYLGAKICRLGALDGERLVGADATRDCFCPIARIAFQLAV